MKKNIIECICKNCGKILYSKNHHKGYKNYTAYICLSCGYFTEVINPEKLKEDIKTIRKIMKNLV